MTATVILVGVRGFGAVHLDNIRRLSRLGRVQLVGLVDPAVAALARLGELQAPLDAPVFGSLSDAVATVGVPDVVVVAVPIPVHAPIAAEALRAGADVLLEKPPFARLADFDALSALERETGRVIQVGFQSLGSSALDLVAEDRFGIGTIRHVRAMGAWVRRTSYWRRSPWAGRRHLGGADVVDGVATNPLAHAVATALRIAGVSEADAVERVDVDAYRTNPIEADDTTALRIVTAGDGPTVTAALTLSASGEQDQPPVIEMVGDSGTLVYRYTLDELVDSSGAVTRAERTDLLENLIDHRAVGRALLVPLGSTGAFMRVVEAIRTAPEPTRVEDRFVTVSGEGDDAHPVLDDVEGWIRAAADIDGTFLEAGAPWAFGGHDGIVATSGEPDGEGDAALLTLVDGAGTVPDSSPRPFLHPLQTVGGVELTARRPADHDWHLGLGFAVADVAGTNLWGGPTFRRGEGYVLRDDHGAQRLDGVAAQGGAGSGRLTLDLTWTERDGRGIATEQRRFAWEVVDDGVWTLDARTRLSASAGALSLGSPGTNGRPGAGYGGWFWRFPTCVDVEVTVADAEGEAAILGRRAPWLCWSARFLGRPGSTGEATILLAQDRSRGAGDPWFVRVSDYQAVGTAVAWDERTAVEPGQALERSLRAVVADGRRRPESLLDLLG